MESLYRFHTTAIILNRQLQDAFTQISSEAIPDKGSSPHSSMSDIKITENGIIQQLQNLKIHKASGVDP
ncbi:hypothetical protein DPMN_062735 [Dreissena polymorpha]|uniref:Uncharacterized protein n=1 Tax=Dreissena polymorpha TaxID=45954 RepID=A0A9D4C974_DREPO|nr:hypothetical protein DPMN_062727 [Dreissena polymorpha]KAH3719851.1 hypothetical protein DPMN_062735 [Dreissena polymorpha]